MKISVILVISLKISSSIFLSSVRFSVSETSKVQCVLDVFGVSGSRRTIPWMRTAELSSDFNGAENFGVLNPMEESYQILVIHPNVKSGREEPETQESD